MVVLSLLPLLILDSSMITCMQHSRWTSLCSLSSLPCYSCAVQMGLSALLDQVDTAAYQHRPKDFVQGQHPVQAVLQSRPAPACRQGHMGQDAEPNVMSTIHFAARSEARPEQAAAAATCTTSAG